MPSLVRKCMWLLAVFLLTASTGCGGKTSTSEECSIPSASGLTLSWDLPTQYTDGMSISTNTVVGDQIKESRVYYGLAPCTCPTGSFYTVAAPASSISLQDLTNAVDLSSLPSGTYEFAITAITQSNVESDCSVTVARFF
jgi:hypothetical protein